MFSVCEGQNYRPESTGSQSWMLYLPARNEGGSDSNSLPVKNRPPFFPMDVMMKSSVSIRRIRIVERPYDVLVTDPTPGKECTSSASYGLGHIPDKGTK